MLSVQNKTKKATQKNNHSVVSGEGIRERLESGQVGLNTFWGTGQVFPVSTRVTSAPPIQGPTNTHKPQDQRQQGQQALGPSQDIEAHSNRGGLSGPSLQGLPFLRGVIFSS